MAGFSPRSRVKVSDKPYTIIERVYHEGWQTCGEVKIAPGGAYSWLVYDIWSNPPQQSTFTGVVPTAIAQQLAAGSGFVDLRDGVRVY